MYLGPSAVREAAAAAQHQHLVFNRELLNMFSNLLLLDRSLTRLRAFITSLVC